MVSSLEIGPRYIPSINGLSSASFLSISPAPARIAGPDLRAVSRASGAPVDTYVPVLRPSNVGVGQFSVEHFAEGRFTEVTINAMHRAVLAAKTDAKWRQMMEDIRQYGRRTGAVGWKDYLGEMRWFDHWYRGPHFIDYVRDPHQVEMVVHPMLTYMKQVADCDDSCLDASSRLWARLDGKLWFGAVSELFSAVSPELATVEPGATVLARWKHDVEVLAPDSSVMQDAKFVWKRVTAMKKLAHPGTLKRVEIHGGRQLLATPNHRLFTYSSPGGGNRKRRLVEIAVGSLVSGQPLAVCKDTQFDVECDPRFDDETLFFYGFWIGDGCYETGHGPKLSCGNDKEMEEYFSKWAAWKGIHVTPRKGRPGDILFNSRELEREMVSVGLSGDSHTKRVPRWVFTLSNAQIAAFLRGYFSADGSQYAKEDAPCGIGISSSSVSLGLSRDVQTLLWRLGIDASVQSQKCKPNAFNPKEYWSHRVAISAEQSQVRFIARIGIFRRVETKEPEGKTRNPHAMANHTVRSVGEADPTSDCVYDLQVEGLQAFVVEGIVSHNSTLFGASMGSLGAAHLFRTYKADSKRPHDWSHVACKIWVPAHGWINEDLTIRGASFGWEPSGFEFKDWPEPRW